MDVVIYTRQSLDRSGEGLAVTRQEDECRALASERGWTVVGTYSDNDISATTGKRRPGFEELLASEHRAVVVWHQDRLLRVSKDLERVVEANLTVHSVQAGALHLDNPTGKAVARTVAAWTTYEGEQKSARQKASARQRAASGKPWWPVNPFGYTQAGDLTPDAALVAQAYEDVLAGRTIADITRAWNAVGALSPRGKAWIRTSVLVVLKSPRNAGLRTYQGEVMGQGTWTPIVSEGTFYAVQAVLADPVRGRGGGARQNLLTGIATCGICGRKMVSATSGAKPYRYRCYRCPVGHLSTKADWLERLVAERLHSPLESGHGPNFRRMGTSPRMAALGAEASSLRSRLDEAAAAYGSGSITLATFTRASADIEARLADNLKACMAEAQAGPIYASGKDFDSMTPAEQHTHLLHTVDVMVEPIERHTRRTPETVKVTTKPASSPARRGAARPGPPAPGTGRSH